MAKLTQKQVNEAVLALAGGDRSGLELLVEGLRSGAVTVAAGRFQLVLKVVGSGPREAFGARLRALRRAAGGPPLVELSEYAGISQSTIIRMMNGQTVPNWGTAFMVIKYLGGDPALFRVDWDLARQHPGEGGSDD